MARNDTKPAPKPSKPAEANSFDAPDTNTIDTPGAAVTDVGFEAIEEKQDETNDGAALEEPSKKAKKQAGADNLDDKEAARIVTELVDCAGGDPVVQALHGLQAQITGTTPIEREAGRIAARDALRQLGK